MKQFKVTYSKAPTQQNPERCLIVKAEDEVEAIVTAFDHLTQKGNVIGKGFGLKLSNEQSKKLNERGVKFDLGSKAGQTVLTGVEDYTVKPQGKVVEG